MGHKELLDNIEKALDEIRPYLLTDGGDISFVSLDEDIVNIKFHGACIGCKVNQMTLTNGVEATIVLVAAVLAFPAPWRARLAAIAEQNFMKSRRLTPRFSQFCKISSGI